MKLDNTKSNAGRFVGGKSKEQDAATRPRIVQVQLKTPVEGAVNAVADGSVPAISSPSGISLSGLQQVMRDHGLVKVEASFRTSNTTRGEAALGANVFQDPEKRKYLDLHFPPGADVTAIVQQLNELPEVERAVAMPTAIPPNAVPTDPLIGTTDQVSADPGTGLENEWYIFRCAADQAWPNTSGVNVVIADIDFGFLVSHQDLVANLDMSRAYNSVDGSANVSFGGDIDHGTGVLGLAAAAANGVGMAGFAYAATLWPIQANGGAGASLPGDAFANAIDWVSSQDTGGKRLVINLEVQTGNFGNYEMVPAVNLAIRNAIAKGITVCVAAGNGDKDAGVGDDGVAIPPTGSILVGATQYDPAQNIRASFSNFGSRIVVSAPGDSDHDLTCSTSSDDAYRNGFGGTSGATPKVSGTVALMLEANPSLTPAAVQQILVSTGSAISVGDGKPIGVFLNTAAAVAQAEAMTGN